MKALITVDVQNDFLPGGNLAVPNGDEIISIINNLQKKFDLVVATQDWHPADHLSFASNHENQKPFNLIDLFGIQQVLWPDHCIQGTDGASFASGLKMEKVATIFRKGMDPNADSYSGFFDNGKKTDTGLSAYLKGKGVTEVYVCGLAADYCVYFTAKDAQGEGFKTYFIKDATREIAEDTYAAALKDMEEHGIIITTSKEL